MSISRINAIGVNSLIGFNNLFRLIPFSNQKHKHRIMSRIVYEFNRIDWVRLPGGKRIMHKEVSVLLFKLVMTGYKFEGHNAEECIKKINDRSKEGKLINYVSHADASEFVRRLRAMGLKVALPTEGEWETTKNKRLREVCWTLLSELYRQNEQDGKGRPVELAVLRNWHVPQDQWKDGAVRRLISPQQRFFYVSIRLVMAAKIYARG